MASKLTNAEKQKRYRAKRRRDAEREKAYKDKEKIRNDSRKKIDSMTARGARIQRKVWRKHSKTYRENKINVELDEVPVPDTPPATPPPNLIGVLPQTAMKRRGRREVRRNRSKLFRLNNQLGEKIEKLEEILAKQKRKTRKYKQRSQRANAEAARVLLRKADENLTPRSRARKLLCKSSIDIPMNHKVSRKLVLCNSLLDELKQMRVCKIARKCTVAKLVASKTVKKYKLLHEASYAVGIKQRMRIAKIRVLTERKNKILIEAFFLRDDVSRATAGKKETVTHKKRREQRRFLVDTLGKLHKRFSRDVPMARTISYATFCRYRPFYVLKPSQEDRNTCLCKLHANLNFKAAKLHLLKLTPSTDTHLMVETIACNKADARCMHNLCIDCNQKTVPIESHDPNEETTWNEWKLVSEERSKTVQGNIVRYTVKVTSKMEICGTFHKLVEDFQKDMREFKHHIFNIKMQSAAYRECKSNLKPWECLLHIDFSENYNCKMTEEIQSYHFGAARHQATLHTVMLYIGGLPNPISICTISDSSDHGPQAIWAHLQPVFDLINVMGPSVKVIHFFSDGPSSQYRQKKNFFLFSTLLFELGFSAATWSFFEAGHGKGAADGIGAAVKRAADDFVVHGTDISTARIMFETLNQVEESKVSLFFIEQCDIAKIAKIVPHDLTVVKGTQNIHQLATCKSGILNYRTISCYCDENNWLNGVHCLCHLPSQVVKMAREEIPKDSHSIVPMIAVRPRCGQGIYTSSDEDPDDVLPLSHLIKSANATATTSAVIVPADTVSPLNIKLGTYVLVLLSIEKGRSKDKFNYRYAAICQGNVEEDGEVKVKFLRYTSNETVYAMEERVASYVPFENILAILPPPASIVRGKKGLRYKFDNPFDVFERK